MRLFLGLDLSVETKLAIDQWRISNYTLLGAGVPTANFHITLAFLGECKPHQLESLLDQLESIESPRFDVLLDDVGYWQKNGILWMGCTQVPDELLNLSRRCRAAARRLHQDRSGQTFHPHITLWRRQSLAPPPPVTMPAIQVHFDEFCLFESVLHKGRVEYRVVESWRLV